MRPIAVAAFLAALAARAGAAETAPPWLAEALRAGSTREKLEPYGAPGLAVTYTTPFLRVARLANQAFRKGGALRAEEVEARAWDPELRIVVGVLPVAAGEGPAGMADPKSIRLVLGAGEVKASRMERSTASQSVSAGGGAPRQVSGGLLRAVFPVPGPAPTSGELEIRYTLKRNGREEEIVRTVPLDFRKTRW